MYKRNIDLQEGQDMCQIQENELIIVRTNTEISIYVREEQKRSESETFVSIGYCILLIEFEAAKL